MYPVADLYADVQRCAEVAGLVYVTSEDRGLRRIRHGRGFRYCGSSGAPASDRVKQRIVELAIPPAWTDVWICPTEDGHLLATGIDERGRKQYLYHPDWRRVRDLLNSYRLIGLAERLPAIRSHVSGQLRRRTLDHDQVAALLVRIIDLSGMRIGGEIYAEENDSRGLTTLSRRHVQVSGALVSFDFPAKSGQRAHIEIRDRRVATLIEALGRRRGRRLFTVDGRVVDAQAVNELLGQLSDGQVRAKDFRTWTGTRTAFEHLREAGDVEGRSRDSVAIAAVDAVAARLGNTRAVARANYVHPDLLAAFLEGTFERYLAVARTPSVAGLDEVECDLLGLLRVLMEKEFSLQQ